MGFLAPLDQLPLKKTSEIAETISKYVSGDRPETGISSSLLASEENNPKPTFHASTSPNSTFHIRRTAGSDTWSVTEASRQRLDAFDQWYLRRILRVPYTAHVTNVSV